MFLITDKLPTLKPMYACYSPFTFKKTFSHTEASRRQSHERIKLDWTFSDPPNLLPCLCLSSQVNMFCTREHFSPFSLSLSKMAHIPINRQLLCRTPCSHHHLFSAAVLGLLGLGLLDRVDGIHLHSFLSNSGKPVGIEVRGKHSGASLQASATLRMEVNHSEPWRFVINNKC